MQRAPASAGALYFVPVAAYFRVRRGLWAAVGLLVGLIILGWDLLVPAGTYVSQDAGRNHLRRADGAAPGRVPNRFSPPHRPAAQKAAVVRPRGGFYPPPFLSSP